jgi:hypothetical protein
LSGRSSVILLVVGVLVRPPIRLSAAAVVVFVFCLFGSGTIGAVALWSGRFSGGDPWWPCRLVARRAWCAVGAGLFRAAGFLRPDLVLCSFGVDVVVRWTFRAAGVSGFGLVAAFVLDLFGVGVVGVVVLPGGRRFRLRPVVAFVLGLFGVAS